MTIITKVGASYVDHMNDDAPEVDSFSRECYQALSSPPFLRRDPGDEANATPGSFHSYSSKKNIKGCSNCATRARKVAVYIMH